MNRWKKGLTPVFAALLIAGLALAGCGILDVENPNNLIEDDLSNPAAAEPMANGVEAAVTRAVSYITAPYSVGSDECTWVGSRDAWGQLDAGALCLAGGVAANSLLRERALDAAEQDGRRVFLPSREMCTDNAAMVAAAAWWRWRSDGPTALDAGADPGLGLPLVG